MHIQYLPTPPLVMLAMTTPTSTDWFTDVSWAVKHTHEFISHWHHRLILNNIGDKLETFQCSKEMVYAIRAALTGAYLVLSTLFDR